MAGTGYRVRRTGYQAPVPGPGTGSAAPAAPAASPAPFAWRIWLPRRLWATIIAQIRHERRIHHDNFHFVECMSESWIEALMPDQQPANWDLTRTAARTAGSAPGEPVPSARAGTTDRSVKRSFGRTKPGFPSTPRARVPRPNGAWFPQHALVRASHRRTEPGFPSTPRARVPRPNGSWFLEPAVRPRPVAEQAAAPLLPLSRVPL